MKVRNTLSAGLIAQAKAKRKQIVNALRVVIEVKRTIVVKRTPIDLAPLRASIHAGVEEKGNIISGTISAGGPTAKYAIVQHEDLTFHHDEGQAKYIESVIFESRPTIMREISALVK